MTIGEGPHWEADSKCLMYVDINAGDVHRWNSETKEDVKVHVGRLTLSWYWYQHFLLGYSCHVLHYTPLTCGHCNYFHTKRGNSMMENGYV